MGGGLDESPPPPQDTSPEVTMSTVLVSSKRIPFIAVAAGITRNEKSPC